MQSQADLNEEACQQLSREIETLESALTKARTHWSTNAKALALLDASQLAWSQYRDAQLKLNDPDEVYGRGSSGSVVPMCLCLEAARMTHDRAIELDDYMKSLQGDVCHVF